MYSRNKQIKIMTTELKKINAIKSINTFEYFGTYNNVEWSLIGEKWNKKMWWYLIANGVKNDMPTNNLKDAAYYMKLNIDNCY